MNLVDCYVVEVVSEPTYLYDKWWIDVIANSYGGNFKTKLMFETKEECLNINKWHHFLS